MSFISVLPRSVRADWPALCSTVYSTSFRAQLSLIRRMHFVSFYRHAADAEHPSQKTGNFSSARRLRSLNSSSPTHCADCFSAAAAGSCRQTQLAAVIVSIVMFYAGARASCEEKRFTANAVKCDRWHLCSDTPINRPTTIRVCGWVRQHALATIYGHDVGGCLVMTNRLSFFYTFL